uniref:Uncharacterized protein n=1 Tax=Lotharella oceanica TaxID=641309 RepID=A0A7S2TJB0_9EUKA|mmetsp:Transcript_14375/g.27310  ORF Transcript_14375/g.27310 Transcript_14375/m.27310 type:complete len:120 (+) Transcript_14375:67-426(+)
MSMIFPPLDEWENIGVEDFKCGINTGVENKKKEPMQCTFTLRPDDAKKADGASTSFSGLAIVTIANGNTQPEEERKRLFHLKKWIEYRVAKEIFSCHKGMDRPRTMRCGNFLCNYQSNK